MPGRWRGCAESARRRLAVAWSSHGECETSRGSSRVCARAVSDRVRQRRSSSLRWPQRAPSAQQPALTELEAFIDARHEAADAIPTRRPLDGTPAERMAQRSRPRRETTSAARGRAAVVRTYPPDARNRFQHGEARGCRRGAVQANRIGFSRYAGLDEARCAMSRASAFSRDGSGKGADGRGRPCARTSERAEGA